MGHLFCRARRHQPTDMQKNTQLVNLTNEESDLFENILLLLEETVKDNDSIQQDQTAPVFTNTQVPNISIRDYFSRLVRYFRMDKWSMLLCVHHLEALMQSSTDIQFDKFTSHRLLGTSAVLAFKFNDCEHGDNRTSASYMASILGVQRDDLNRMECAAIQALDYRLFVSPENCDRIDTTIRETVKCMNIGADSSISLVSQ